MLVDAGNGSYAQVTAPLRVTLHCVLLALRCVSVCGGTLFFQGFLPGMGTHSANAWGFLMESHCTEKALRRIRAPECGGGGNRLVKTLQLRKRRNCFSKILPRQQIYLLISSLFMTSPGWRDEVCSEFNTSTWLFFPVK